MALSTTLTTMLDSKTRALPYAEVHRQVASGGGTLPRAQERGRWAIDLLSGAVGMAITRDEFVEGYNLHIEEIFHRQEAAGFIDAAARRKEITRLKVKSSGMGWQALYALADHKFELPDGTYAAVVFYKNSGGDDVVMLSPITSFDDKVVTKKKIARALHKSRGELRTVLGAAQILADQGDLEARRVVENAKVLYRPV